jgi:hypothetical protein
MFFFKVFAKFIGIILIIIGAATLIGLIIGLFSLGVANIIHIPGLDMVELVNAGETPIWLVSLLSFFAIGIPFFFLFYLGLKILINNLKSIGNIAKFTLLGLWLVSVIALAIVGIRQASEHAFEERYTEKTQLPITASDTLLVKMVDNDNFNSKYYRHHNNFKLAYNENGDKVLYSSNVDIIVKSTTDSIAKIAIRKSADGRDYEKAIERAKNIDYNFEFKSKTLSLNSYLTTDPENKFSDQEIDIVLSLPEGSVVYFNNSTKNHLHYRTYDGNIVSRDNTNHYLKIHYGDAECLDCPEEDFKVKVDTPRVKLNDDGLEIKSDDVHLKIDESGLKAEAEEVNVNINSEGVEIESE